MNRVNSNQHQIDIQVELHGTELNQKRKMKHLDKIDPASLLDHVGIRSLAGLQQT